VAEEYDVIDLQLKASVADCWLGRKEIGKRIVREGLECINSIGTSEDYCLLGDNDDA
jgi:hypothetical protein